MKIIKTILKISAACIALFLIGGFVYYFNYIKPFKEQMAKTMLVNFDMNLLIVQGGGGNSGILLLDSMVLVVDSKMDEAALELHKIAKRMAEGKPIVLVNTHYHPDHVGGNHLYAGQTIVAGGNYTEQLWKQETGSNQLPDIWVKDSLIIETRTERISIVNIPNPAHTESDLVVFLNNKKVLFTGDVVLNNQIPLLQGSAKPQGYLSAFDYLSNRFDLNTIVPGHGNIGSKKVFSNFKQYFLDMNEASKNSTQKDALIAKYDGWAQLPFFMSPRATIRKF
jgi:glyoxylase-like metal-dependent hydrolase (beta-lactamase superfamily II)